MIKNITNYFDDILNFASTITLLTNSDFKYYLTGSRYFGNETKNSDWDFFVEYEPDVIEELKSLGFVMEYVDDVDPTVKFVYKYTSGKFEIHVIITEFINIRNFVNELIKNTFPNGFDNSNKQKIKELLKAMYELILIYTNNTDRIPINKDVVNSLIKIFKKLIS